jgi:O-succinylhomoserine sulfhydrylase
MYLTSGFVFDDVEEMRASFAGEIQRDLYSRYSNPNTSEFITKVCEMEGAEDGFAFSSGMAAIYTSLKALLQSGDHILASRSIFGATHTLLVEYFPKWGIECDFFDSDSLEEIRSLTRSNTKVVFAESPTNPGLDVLDLELLSVLTKEAGALLVIDNCFASPYLQNPILFGADLVIHSATKLMDGQGRVLGGITVGSEDLIASIRQLARMTGPALSPFNAWILSKSLETLSLRVDKQSDNAMQIAEFLSRHELVEEVRYPFLESHPQYHLAKKTNEKGWSGSHFQG